MTARKPLPPPAKSGMKQGTRWKPGQSGNPAGKPKGTRHPALVALDRIGEDAAAGILRAVVVSAKAGDLRACEIILARLWPIRKGRPVRLALPDIRTGADLARALATVVAATAAGNITPEEASAVAGVLEMQGRALEHAELENRIAALEAALEAAHARQ